MPTGGCDSSGNCSVRRFGGDGSRLSAGFSFDVIPWYDMGSDCDVITSAHRKPASAGRVQSGRHARSTAAQNIRKRRLLCAVLMLLACRRRDRAANPPGPPIVANYHRYLRIQERSLGPPSDRRLPTVSGDRPRTHTVRSARGVAEQGSRASPAARRVQGDSFVDSAGRRSPHIEAEPVRAELRCRTGVCLLALLVPVLQGFNAGLSGG